MQRIIAHIGHNTNISVTPSAFIASLILCYECRVG